jgi:MFS superfamily sulfate permease-like transporter
MMSGSPQFPSIGEVCRNFKSDFLASLVVFLVALPLCMGIAIASGAPVAAGLITGIVGGLVVATISGCPLQVSGPAAGLTVIVYDIIARFGLEMLGVVVLLAGLFQLLAGVFRLGQWFRAVSPAVVKGMLAGIGILILASQFHVMIDDKPHGHGLENLATIPAAVWKAVSSPPSFGTADARSRRSEALRAIGELHRRQVVVQEHVAEYYPHTKQADQLSGHAAAAQKPQPARLDLTELEAQQAQIDRELTALSRSLSTVTAKLDTTHGGQIQAALQTAVGKSAAALHALHEDRLDGALRAQDESVAALQALLASLKNHGFAAQIGILTIVTIVLWGWLVPKRLRFVPAPLIAVTAATAIAAALSMPVLYVEVPDNLWEEVHFPSWTVLRDAPWVALTQAALLIAVVASAETLLCATAVDQLHSGPRTRYDKELMAQGVGNVLCGLMGALPMTGVIVRSSANVLAGGKTRISAILHGVWLLIFVAGLAFLLRMIPTSCLAAVLVYTGYKLVDWKSVRKLAQYGWGEVGIYAATVATIVIVDLLAGVLVGVGLAAAKLLYTFSHLNVRLDVQPEQQRAVLSLAGTATFIRLPKLAAALDRVPQDAELHVDLEHLDYVDHACLDLLITWAKQHEATGGRLVIDWESLHANFRRENGNGAGHANSRNNASQAA